MLNRSQHKEKRQQVFMNSVEGFANVMAFIAAFFLTPEIFVRTIGFVSSYTAHRYGADLVDFVGFVWFVAVALLTFFMARATVTTAIVAAGLAIATKFV